jgi:hypothetical protein
MNVSDTHILSTLPQSLQSWKDIDPFDRHSKPEWWMPWESLRPFFESKGYILFKAGGPDGELSVPQPKENGYTSPAAESFALYGDREGFKSTFGRVSSSCRNTTVCLIFSVEIYGVCCSRQVFQAFSLSQLSYAQLTIFVSHDRDVVIKLVRKGGQGRSEYEILRLLNSAPLRHHPGNATISVLEFIEYDDWHFVVMPFCDGCDEVPFRNVAEALDFAEQVLSVSTGLVLLQLRSAPLIVMC